MNVVELPWVSFLLAIFLASHGLRKKSLSPSGAFAAFVVGFFMMSTQSRVFGVSLISFYLIGSRATKVGKERKALLEEGHQEAGYRTAWQVLCNSCTAFLASLLWTSLFAKSSLITNALPNNLSSRSELYVSDIWCPLSASHGGGWSRWLLLVTLGHFACCLGDTLASEIGILSKSSPILITTFSRVPPGTNGGISPLGIAASALGGIIMGLTMGVTLLMESTACRAEGFSLVRDLTLTGLSAGLFGSLIDSLMGATIQRTRYSLKTNRILLDESTDPEKEAKVISGLNLLTNNQINLISSIITALSTAYLAPRKW